MTMLIVFLVGLIAGGTLATWVVLAVALAQHMPDQTAQNPAGAAPGRIVP